MRTHVLILGLLSLALLPAVTAQTPPRTGIKGFTEPDYAKRLSFTISGLIEKVNIERGARVKKGDSLITVESLEQQAEVAKLKGRLATADLEIEAADKSEELAKTEKDRMEQMLRDGAAAESEVQRARLQHELSKIEAKLRRKQKESIQLELKQNESILDRYLLRAPVDGWVEEVIVSEGETVERLRPVLALVVIDPLKIDVQVDVAAATELAIGDRAWIRSTVISNTPPLLGTVTFKAKVADAASDTQTVGIELPNPTGLDAGMDVMVTFSEPTAMAGTEK